MNALIDIKAESFPWHFRFVGVVLLVLAAVMLGMLWYVSPIFFLIGTILLSTYSGTMFNAEKKIYREYHAILFVKTGDWKKYDYIEKIFINASKESQQMHPIHTQIHPTYTSTSSTFYYTSYDAYLKFPSGQKIYLLSRKDKAALVKKLKPVAEVLETELVDYTG